MPGLVVEPAGDPPVPPEAGPAFGVLPLMLGMFLSNKQKGQLTPTCVSVSEPKAGDSKGRGEICRVSFFIYRKTSRARLKSNPLEEAVLGRNGSMFELEGGNLYYTMENLSTRSEFSLRGTGRRASWFWKQKPPVGTAATIRSGRYATTDTVTHTHTPVEEKGKGKPGSNDRVPCAREDRRAVEKDHCCCYGLSGRM